MNRNSSIFKRTLFAFYLSVLISCIFIFNSCTKHKVINSDLNIGLAEVNYTPPVGLDLVGNYRGDDYASRGVHDSLFAKAVVIQNKGGAKVAFLTVDICKLPKETIQMMRTYISSRIDIQPGNIMIQATHTHSGPRSELNAPLAKEYLSKAASAVIVANEKLKPGRFSIGRVEENSVSFNRRLKCMDGKTHMSWEKLNSDFVIGPLGPVDPEVITIWIEQEGKLMGALINFGCHVTTLTGNNWLYSADFPGYLSDTLKNVLGDNFISLYLNGCCGNVTQVNYKKGFIDTYEESRRIGNILGKAVLKTFDNKNDIVGSDVIISNKMVPVKRISISEEQYQWAQLIMAKVAKEGMPPIQSDGIPDAQFATQWVKMYGYQRIVDSLEVMVVGIGSMALAGLPGEMFCEFGMEIKNESFFKNTLVMGLTNDAAKYFPTEISFKQGPEGYTPMITGYETTPGATLYEIGSGEELTRSAIKQLNEISEIIKSKNNKH